jgi:hypothetical protein
MLTITGYYNQGNLGDEAFVAVLKEQLADLNPTFTPGKFPTEPTDVLVGGGEFEPWMVKDSNHERIAALGIGLIRDGIGEIRAKWIEKFTDCFVRDARSLQLAQVYNLPAQQGADLALLLKPTKGPHSFADRIVIVPRLDIDPTDTIQRYNPNTVVLAPFHPYDTAPNPICDQFYIPDPNQMLYALQGAREVICWGKLHACVLAQAAQVPHTDLAPDWKTRSFREMVYRYHQEQLLELAQRSVDTIHARFS